MAVFEDNTYSIGRSPLVKLGRLGKGLKATVFGKVEGRNPAYSVKCRTATSMVWDAEKRGVLKPGGTIVEPTSGNTGIGLAFVCAARGYKLVVTMPESYSIERVKLLKAYGAQVELTTAENGMSGAIQRAEEIAAENPGYFMPQQFKNPANPRIHYETTGPEIYDDLEGKVDVFVAGVGTGGTVTGVSRYLKEGRGLDTEIVAVEPAKSAVLSGENPGPHGIDGIGAGFIPDILDITLVDRIETVSDEESIEYARRLAREEGLLSGPSCGAATAVAMRLARDEAYAGKNIVCVLPDAGERYLSTMLFEPSFLKDV